MQLKFEVYYIFVATASTTKFQRLIVAIINISRLKAEIYLANFDYNFLEFRQNELDRDIPITDGKVVSLCAVDSKLSLSKVFKV